MNFSQAPKFTEISDLLEYLLRKNFYFGVYRRQQSPKKKFFPVIFTSQSMLIGPLQPLPGSKNLNRQVGTEDDSKTAQDCSGLAPKMDDVGPPDSFFD